MWFCLRHSPPQDRGSVGVGYTPALAISPTFLFSSSCSKDHNHTGCFQDLMTLPAHSSAIAFMAWKSQLLLTTSGNLNIPFQQVQIWVVLQMT